jgi:uronate dehydrogenase
VRVVVTGGAGVVGAILRGAPPRGWDLAALDRRRRPGISRVDVTRRPAVRRAGRGADAIVHLAGTSDPAAPWRDVDRATLAARVVLESAVEAGVPRVVVASSNRVMAGYERDEPYASVLAGRTAGVDPGFRRLRTDDPVRPESRYAAGKVAIEATARVVAETTPVTVVCLRIGTVLPDGRPRTPRHFATLLTPGDLVRLVERAVEAPIEGFSTFFGVSSNTWAIWDRADAVARLGYEPVDDAERWR